MIDNHQVVGHRVEGVHIAPQQAGRGGRLGAHLLVEHPPAQRLHRVDLGFHGGDAHAQVARPQLAEARAIIGAQWRPVALQPAAGW